MERFYWLTLKHFTGSCLVLQTQAILNARLKEELNISLSISVYDVARNEMAREHRKEQEAKKAEEERIRKEKEMDYLAPFLARIGDPPKLTKQQMQEVTQVCQGITILLL